LVAKSVQEETITQPRIKEIQLRSFRLKSIVSGVKSTQHIKR